MRIKKIYTILLLVFITNSYAQELNLPVFAQYLADNNFVISPTYAGIGDNLKIRANGLSQWVGIKDAPRSQSLYGDIRIADRTGVGLSLYNDRNGNTIQSGAKISFAHHLILDYYSKLYLSFGISYNINNFRIDIDNFVGTREVPNIDPAIAGNDRKTANNNFDIGALLRYKNAFFSFNANNVLPKKLERIVSKLEPDLLLNYQIYTGYTFSGGKKSGLEFEPSIYYQLFSSDNRSSTDVNFKFRKYNKNFDYYWAGISYRFLNDQFFKSSHVGPMFGFQKSSFYFGYAYQITTNELASFNSGSHLVTIGFNFLQNISNCPCTQSAVRN